MLEFFKLLLNDFQNNISYKGKIIVINYRILNYIYNFRLFYFILFIPIFSCCLFFYKVFVELMIGCEISYKTKIGEGFVIHHGQSIVINKSCVIKDNVIIRHCTTIGNKHDANGKDLGSPTINENVEIGSNSVIIGPIKIGKNVIIGAGSVVVKDIKDFKVVAGNPARELKKYCND